MNADPILNWPSYRAILISGMMLMASLMPASTIAKTISSGNHRVAMLELYTSQGCSSCPPAENWLAKFKDDPKLWQQIVPVNFHVDYWDYLGWQDRYANKLFSQRQRKYKQLKHATTVGTPGFIVNGEGWNGWFYQLNYPQFPPTAVGTLAAEVDETSRQADITFSPLKRISGRLIVHVAILGFELATDILSGENKNRQLNHDFVVIGYQHRVLTTENNVATTKLNLPDVSSFNSNRQAIVFWVSKERDPTPLQVAANWL